MSAQYKTRDNTHKFAIYLKQQFIERELTRITDAQIIHRITHILRCAVDDELIFFNENIHGLAVIRELTHKLVCLFVEKIEPNVTYQPKLTVQLALLKREALDDAVSLLTALGVNEIELYFSEKVHRSWGGQGEYDRLNRCIIASAEQSKCFVLPIVHAPVAFEQLLKSNADTLSLVCDADGLCLIPIVAQTVQKNGAITLLIGPEGDFTEHEKQFICQCKYQAWRLTKTILRAEQAAQLAAGIIRSCI